MQQATVCVIGLGYIGLPTAALLASNGYRVIGVDVNQHVVDTINQGRIHIVEPDLDAYVRSAVTAGRLRAYTSPQVADIYIVCVPTPFHEGAGIPQPNVDYVLAAARSIAPFVKAGSLVILESTSPVGTTHLMTSVLADAGVDVAAVHVAYCPERVLPGKIMTELIENDRVVGGLNSEATRRISAFYRTFVKGEVLETEAKTAEMCKLTENSFRDVNIAFANELSLICAGDGINVWDVIQLANCHPRVKILQPGVGVGGHCIAVDPWFIVARDPQNSRLIKTAREVNDQKSEWVISEIIRIGGKANAKSGDRLRVACLGLTFKPDIDDLRESPALHIAEALLSLGHEVLAVEPNIGSHERVQLVSLESAIENAEVVAILVRHRQFSQESTRKALIEAGAIDFCGALKSS
jgi:UDP-N-acetyl-D-mannosaminuronic acid dehydrogenase